MNADCVADGYVAGLAWELGILRGFQDVDGDLLSPRLENREIARPDVANLKRLPRSRRRP